MPGTISLGFETTIRVVRDILGSLVENGADVDAADSRGETALHAAARWGRRDVVLLLVSSGADVDAELERCASVFDLAAAREQA
jgi:ankyrin repeat protein